MLELGADMDADRAMALARQVVDALHHLHAHKVVHGDVKLNNFMVQPATGGGVAAASDAPRVVLTDFGCAVQLGSGPADMDDDFEVHAAEATNFAFGNPAHQAPEVVAALSRKAQLGRGSAERVVIPLASQDAFAAGLVMCVFSRMTAGLQRWGDLSRRRLVVVALAAVESTTAGGSRGGLADAERLSCNLSAVWALVVTPG